MPRTITGLFTTQDEAEQAAQELTNMGIDSDAVKVIGKPGFLSAIGIGGDTTDKLMDAGVPANATASYADAIEQGGALVAVTTSEQWTQRVYETLQRYGASNLSHPSDTTSTQYATTQGDTRQYAANQGETTLPVVEEELQVDKREVQGGGVRVSTNVTEEPIEQDIRLREEHVNVERRAVDRPVTEADARNLRDRTIEVTESHEEPVVNKQARVVEEVVINKEVGERTETVRDTVRRTDVDVEQLDRRATEYRNEENQQNI